MEATRVALITLITPVIALLLGNILNDESTRYGTRVGTAAILSGLLLFEYVHKLSRLLSARYTGNDFSPCASDTLAGYAANRVICL